MYVVSGGTYCYGRKYSYKYIRDVVIRDSYVSTTALGQITTANIISDSSIKPDAET